LPDSPGKNTLQKASDIAVWKEDVRTFFAPAEAFIALVSDNTWGTRIGRRHYQGARGEGALTTMLEPVTLDASLWKRVWLNVLPADRWQNYYGRESLGFEFPWNQPLTNNSITPRNSHSAAILWQMPRRWRLTYAEDGRVKQVHRQTEGRQYEGWRHPLTPYSMNSDGTWRAAKVSPHTGYGEWAGIALNARTRLKPATVVTDFIENAWDGEALRIRCCGWALGSAGEAGTWVDHTVPFYGGADPTRVSEAIDAAEKQRNRLRTALTEDLQAVRQGKAHRRIRPELGRFADDLYVKTESLFYSHVRSHDWSDWSEELRRSSEQIFWSVMDAHRIDPFASFKVAKRAGFEFDDHRRLR
jgi:CRISPR system Cascade subunit CasA